MSYQKTTFVDRISEYPTRRKLTTIDTQQVYGTWDVSRDEGTVSQEGTALNAATFNQMQDNIAAAFAEVDANIAPTYDSTATYSEGDLVIYEGVLYKANVDISTAEEWDATHWDAVKITEIMGTGSAVIDDSVVSTETAWSSSRIAGFLPTDTASGAIATFTDGADGIPVKSLVASIVATQSGSGTPSPTNVRPISGWSSVNVTRCGKNFIDLTLANLESGSINGNTGALETATNRVRNKDYYPFPFDKLYNGNYVLTIPSGYSIAMRFYDSTGTYITMSGASTGWLTSLPSDMYGKGVAFVKFVFRKSDNSDITPSSISALTYLLETGSTATAYEPYNGTTANIPLGSTYYGGTLDVTTGVLTDYGDVPIELNDETISWSYSSANAFFYANIPNSVANDNYMCNKYNNIGLKYDGAMATADNYSIGYAVASGLLQIKVKNTNYTNVTDFKNSLSGVYLYFEHSNPTTIQLTPTEVKTILGNNNIFADSGDVEVVYRADIGLYIAKKTA